MFKEFVPLEVLHQADQESRFIKDSFFSIELGSLCTGLLGKQINMETIKTQEESLSSVRACVWPVHIFADD